MAGFTDLPMRSLAFAGGAALAYTEMISANALAYDSPETQRMVTDTQKDRGPVALQLFGYEITHIETAIDWVEAHGKYAFLDFNLGCPVPKVMKQNAGSHLLLDLDYLYTLLRAIVIRSKHPVVAKTRLGFTDPDDIVKIVKVLEDAGVSAIAIHARTRSEFYAGKPHYDEIAKAKAVATIPIIANGNIDDSNAFEVMEKTKADAVMIARKALGNPLVFTNLVRKEKGLAPLQLTFAEQERFLKEHLAREYDHPLDLHVVSLQMRAIAPAYFASFPNAREIRSLLVKCQSEEDYLGVLAQAEDQLRGKDDRDGQQRI